ncbi:hypothetical protein BH10PSE10_BH10PSE10_00040 [soil metagenome]
MKTILSILCLLASTIVASAQYGVSNVRDGNGNLVRSSGMNSPRNYDQQPVNNVQGGANRTAPGPAPSIGVIPGSANGVRR